MSRDSVVQILLGASAGALTGWLVPLAWLASRRFLDRWRYRQRLATLEAIDAEVVGAFPELRTIVTERWKPNVDPGSPYLYLTGLEIEQLRCFSAALVEPRYPGEDSDLALPNVNLLLGDNGSGKSTVLRAIAMAALGPILDSSGFVPNRLVRQGSEAARVSGSFVVAGSHGPAGMTGTVILQRRRSFEQINAKPDGPYWEDLFDESSPSFFVAGYGTQRRVTDEHRADPSLERGRRRRRYQRVASLFDESASLVPFGAWLPQVDSRRQAEVKHLLGELLPPGARFTGAFEGAEPVFSRSGLDLPFRALSDGFRSYIGWLGDLLFQISAAAPDSARLRDVGGIVLVDEVDLLLHPSWQRIVVPTISTALPNIQFFFTTHSPIVTGTLRPENILVAREDTATGTSTLSRIEADVHGLNAEQVLLSSYFDMETTRAPDAAPALAELARAAVEGDPEATRRYLRALAEGPPSGKGTSKR